MLEVVYSQQNFDDIDYVWACSYCDLLWVLADGISPSKNNMNFCPQCGGKIVEERPIEEEI